MNRETRTYKGRAEYNIAYVSSRRKRLKDQAIQLKGGACFFCGYSKYTGALDFHHIDSSKKKFNLSLNNLFKSWEIIVAEINKCVLVCANCHRELHGGILSLPSSKHV